MAKSCKKCAGVSGMDDIPTMEIAAAAVAAIATAQIDKAVTVDANGNPKDNFFAKNPMAKNAAYAAAGVMLTTMKGEMYQGAGIGMAVYGLTNIVTQFMEQNANAGVYGPVNYKPPSVIGGKFGPTSSASSMINPSVLGQYQNKYKIPGQQNAKQKSKMYRNPMMARAL